VIVGLDMEGFAQKGIRPLKSETYWQDYEKRLERIREAIGFGRDNDLRPRSLDKEASNSALRQTFLRMSQTSISFYRRSSGVGCCWLSDNCEPAGRSEVGLPTLSILFSINVLQMLRQCRLAAKISSTTVLHKIPPEKHASLGPLMS